MIIIKVFVFNLPLAIAIEAESSLFLALSITCYLVTAFTDVRGLAGFEGAISRGCCLLVPNDKRSRLVQP